MRASHALVLAALLAGGAGCNGCKKPVKAGPGTGSLAALTSPTPSVAMPVPGFGDAVVSVPIGTTRPMPVLVAVLGIGDTPEEQCDTWRDIVGERAFVLCVRGAKHYVIDGDDGGTEELAVVAKQAPPPPTRVKVDTPAEDDGTGENGPSETKAVETPPPVIPPGEAATYFPMPTPPSPTKPKAEARQVGFYPVDVPTLDRELLAALAALKARFKLYVAETNLVYAGFSRGAFLGASLVSKRPDKFGRAIFIEGGQSAWTPESATAFAKNGGKRVLFACGTTSCVDEVTPPTTLLKGQRVETKTVHGAGEGHGYKKQVKEELRKSFDWVVDGDPAWP